MTTIEAIQKRVNLWDYRGLPDAIADLRVLLDEVKRLRDENARLELLHRKDRPNNTTDW